MNFDDVLHELGQFGRFHKRLFTMLFLSGIPNAFPVTMFVYMQYNQNFHCALPDWIKLSKNSSEYQNLLNATTYWEINSSGEMKRSQCKTYDVDFGNASYPSHTFTVSTNVTDCKYGYEFENMDTAIAEFNLVCHDAWKPPLTITLYMAAKGIAAFSGYLSDRCGRRPLFLAFTFAQFFFTGLLSISWNYSSYVIFTMLVGLSGTANYVVAYVLATEMMGLKHQLPTGIFICFAYVIGYIMTPLISYIFPNWRWYLRSTSIIGVLYLPLLCYFPESLRLHMVSKNEKEAKALLKEIASENGRKIDAEMIYNRFQAFQDSKSLSLKQSRLTASKKDSSYLLQLSVPTMRVRYFTVCFSWFVASLVYYAIALNPTMLSGDRLTNIFFSGLSELPGLAISYYLPQYIGRVRATSLLFLLCGISSISAPFLREVHTVLMTILVLMSKMASSAAFNMIYLITSEISPTLVRNTSMGVASVCARIGGITMPYLMMIGDEQKLVPCVVMGIVSTVCSFMYLWFIPETGGTPMPDSIKTALQNSRIYGFKVYKKFPKEIKTEKSDVELETVQA